MTSRRVRKPALNVALFPFLAVLICTMGALIVLLVLVVQQARVSAGEAEEAKSTEAAVSPEREKLEQQRIDEEWRRGVLERQREAMTKQLADGRLELGHLEDHIRRLQEKWQQLQAAARQLAETSTSHHAQQTEVDQQLAEVQASLEDAQQELAAAKERAANQPRSFAIIPYPGPNGTQRRPIYIECTSQGITLQPEGVVLRADDFQGPLGPGNPLDAALRTIREHQARLGTNAYQGEPYPLLVVRPDGAIAYNVARLAMKAWDDEFGYELVGSQMSLAFPPPDPHLRELLKQSIQEARERQAALARAMPSQFHGEGIDDLLLGGDGTFTAVPLDSAPDGPLGSARDGPQGGALGGARTGVPGGSLGSTSGEPFRNASDEAQGGPSRAQSRGPSRAGSSPAESRGLSRAGSRGQAEMRFANNGAQDGPGGPNASGVGTPAGASFDSSAPRGRNWGQRSPPSGRSTAVTRAIRVVCEPQRLVIVPDRSRRAQPTFIDLPGGPAAAIDAFVAAIWDEVDRWGIAVPGGYWKPTLRIVVAPGGEAHFRELQRALEGSGLPLERESP